MNDSRYVLQISWNDGLVVKLPADLAAALGLADGSLVELTLEEGAILLRPAAEELTLDQLLAGSSDDNRHEEVDLGPAQGNEFW